MLKTIITIDSVSILFSKLTFLTCKIEKMVILTDNEMDPFDLEDRKNGHLKWKYKKLSFLT